LRCTYYVPGCGDLTGLIGVEPTPAASTIFKLPNQSGLEIFDPFRLVQLCGSARSDPATSTALEACMFSRGAPRTRRPASPV
jgi:hypothetical protein